MLRPELRADMRVSRNVDLRATVSTLRHSESLHIELRFRSKHLFGRMIYPKSLQLFRIMLQRVPQEGLARDDD